MDAITEHRQHADAVRRAATGGTGESAAAIREAVLTRAAGGPAIAEPYDALARQVGEAAYRVTDEQVASVRAAEGSDKGAFEIVMAASIGAGLSRWEQAIQVIDEAGDAPS